MHFCQGKRRVNYVFWTQEKNVKLYTEKVSLGSFCVTAPTCMSSSSVHRPPDGNHLLFLTLQADWVKPRLSVSIYLSEYQILPVNGPVPTLTELYQIEKPRCRHGSWLKGSTHEFLETNIYTVCGFKLPQANIVFLCCVNIILIIFIPNYHFVFIFKTYQKYIFVLPSLFSSLTELNP